MKQFKTYKSTCCTLAILWIFAMTLMAVQGWEMPKKPDKWHKDTPVAKVLEGLGAAPPLHALDSINEALAERGAELVKQGWTWKPNGHRTSRQSRHYVCTDCHNLKPETPDLKYHNPKAKLDFAMQKDLPFLPGTTLYGVVNRESWYNGDYQQKYGDLAKSARDTLRNAIQLCATECSQGRAFTDWELKAVMHYLWSIQLKLSDINPDTGFLKMLNKVKGSDGNHPLLIKKLKSNFGTQAPATFADALPADKRGYGKDGDPEKGAFIYENGCRHCHYSGGTPNLTLDYSVLTFNQLARHLDDYTHDCVYQVVRYGISPKKGYRPYMPQYPLEKMNRKQMEHLVAYIKQEANPSLFDNLFKSKNK